MNALLKHDELNECLDSIRDASTHHDVDGKGRDAFKTYRAPGAHGEALIDPPVACWKTLAAKSRFDSESDSNWWQSLRSDARQQMLSDAVRYTAAYRNVDWATAYLGQQRDAGRSPTIIASGHQPTLFHPGVWFKNFALDHAARKLNGIAVNLIVDNDIASGVSIRVPTIDSGTGDIKRTAVQYDDVGGGVPYEHMQLSNVERFKSFDDAVVDALSGLTKRPAIKRLWDHAREAISRCNIAGCVLAQTRHGLEAELGLQTLEIPLGVVCRGKPFAQFAVAILSEIERFTEVYNTAADRYRSAHGIRSTSHPVPNLGEQGDWIEAPFWIYAAQGKGRLPLWVRRAGDELVLADAPEMDAERGRLPFSNGNDAAVAELSSRLLTTLKLRPRALITTMYARMVLSDLFLHGIGGGKYDQLGDLISSDFFNVTPPHYVVLSATIQMTQGRDVALPDISSIRRSLRDTRFQPERFCDEATLPADLVRRKAELLAQTDRTSDRDWFAELDGINVALSSHLESVRRRLREELHQAQRDLIEAKHLQSREHPFCIFDLDELVATYRSLLQGEAASS